MGAWFRHARRTRGHRGRHAQNLLVRMQTPRFFVETDEVVLSANVHNYLATAKSVQVALDLDGAVLRPLDATVRTVQIAAGGEQRVDWRVRVSGEGPAVVRMKALTDEESDAVEMRFPGLCSWHAQDRKLRRRDPSRRHPRQVHDPRARQTPARAVAAGNSLFANAGRCVGGRPAVHGRVSLRLHRADVESLSAYGGRPARVDRYEARPGGHS